MDLLYLFMIFGFYFSSAQVAGFTYYKSVDMYYQFRRSPMKWLDAKLACEMQGGSLAMPKNSKEMKVINDILKEYPANTLPVTHPDYALLGFHDIFEEGEYITLKGDALQYYFHEWSGGQPDNAGNEDCGSMHRNGMINDYPCQTPAVFICQKEGRHRRTIDSDPRCPTIDVAYRHYNHSEKCYKLHLNPRKWADARAVCSAEGGNLAIPNDDVELQYLASQFNLPENRVHYVVHKDYALLGFHDLYREGHFVTVLEKPLPFEKWGGGQPDNAGGNENCGSMHGSGVLNDFPCSVPAVFFCEMDAVSEIFALDSRASYAKEQ